MSTTSPREGMMAVVRNRRAMITGVQAFDAEDSGRFHMVEVLSAADAPPPVDT